MTQQIPQINLVMTSTPIIANARKLKTQWTVQMATDLGFWVEPVIVETILVKGL